MRPIKFIVVSVAVVFMAGCGIKPETVATLREAVAAASDTSAGPVDSSLTSNVLTQFDPPYPNRVDPFTFPESATYSGEEPGTSITSAAQVDILGFADVGEPKVLIRAQELTLILGLGDQHNGVEVIAIDPPAVKLRMGNIEWTATMFDKTSADRE